MLNFLKKLKLVFSYGPELEEILNELRRAREDQEHKAKQHHLHLCLKHQQEQNRSHYAEHNCDYCKLTEKVKYLTLHQPVNRPKLTTKQSEAS